MTNFYVSKMKKVLETYLQQQKDGNAEILRNSSYWQAEYAATENAKVRARQAQQFVDAQNEIGHIFEIVRNNLAKANFPNVEHLTADRLIFDSGMALTADEIKGFVEKYHNNFTMLRLIRDYIARQPQTLELATIEIHLPDEQIAVYQWFAEEALKVLYKISVNGLVLQQPLEVEFFDDERQQNIAGKLAVIGDGHGLNRYADANVPERAKRQFDNIQLRAHYVTADLHDRSV